MTKPSRDGVYQRHKAACSNMLVDQHCSTVRALVSRPQGSVLLWWYAVVVRCGGALCVVCCGGTLRVAHFYLSKLLGFH